MKKPNFAKKLQEKNNTPNDNKKTVILTSTIVQPNAYDSDNKKRLLELKPEQLKRDPNQPRIYFSDSQLLELLTDIETNGQLQPILIGNKDPDDGLYPIIFGERRWRSISMSKNNLKVLAQVANVELLNKMIIQRSENKNRVSINALEDAIHIKRITDLCENMSKDELAEKLNMSKSQLIKNVAVASCKPILEIAKDIDITGDLEALYSLSTIYKKHADKLETIDLINILKNQKGSLRSAIRHIKKQIDNGNTVKVNNLATPQIELNSVSMNEYKIKIGSNTLTMTIDDLKMLKKLILNIDSIND